MQTKNIITKSISSFTDFGKIVRKFIPGARATAYVAIDKNKDMLRVMVGQLVIGRGIRVLGFTTIYKNDDSQISWQKRLSVFVLNSVAKLGNIKVVSLLSYPFTLVKACTTVVEDDLSGEELIHFLRNSAQGLWESDNCYFDYQQLVRESEVGDNKNEFLLVAAECESVEEWLVFLDKLLLQEAILDVDLYAFERAAKWHALVNSDVKAKHMLRVYLHVDEYAAFLVAILGGEVVHSDTAASAAIMFEHEQTKTILLDLLRAMPEITTAKVGQIILSGGLVDAWLCDELRNESGVEVTLYECTDYLEFRNSMEMMDFDLVGEQMTLSFGLLLRGMYGGD